MKTLGYIFSIIALFQLAIPVYADPMPKPSDIKSDNFSSSSAKYICTQSDLKYFNHDQSRLQLAKGNTTEEIIGAMLMGLITVGSVALVVFNARRAAGL